MVRYVSLLLAGLVVSAPLGADVAVAPSFTPAEMERIRALGPWPPPFRKDPGNRVSGQPLAIELGRRLFRDARMSPVGYIACVTCHQPDRAFTDLKARAHGLADLPRNTPSLANLGEQRWYGWAGSSDSLWMASIRPMLDPREFDGNTDSVARIFSRDPELAACYRRVFGESALRNRERTVVNVGKALAAYVETLVTERTPFDAFRDALLRRDANALAAYSSAAQRGLKLFIGAAGCVDCHGGPNFSDGKFHAAASARPHSGVATDGRGAPTMIVADAGRYDGARELKASRFNLLGPHNDDATHRNALGTSRLAVHENLHGHFRTPSLRNVAVTAPFMHDGHIEDLRDAVLHALPAPADGVSKPLGRQQLDDLVAFLKTLTDRHGARRPWSPTSDVRCP